MCVGKPAMIEATEKEPVDARSAGRQAGMADGGLVRRLRAMKGEVTSHLGLSPPGRAVKVRPDDSFLVSYPRSGNTWLRFLVANVLSAEERVDFEAIERRIPDVYVVREREIETRSDRRIFKSHEYLDPRYPRVVYIHRDPRDVALSYYYYHLKIGAIPDDHPMDQFVADFVAGDLDPFGSWSEHVGEWLGAGGQDTQFLPLSYEKLLADTVSELSRVCEFLELTANDDTIRDAVAKSSAESMRRAEAAHRENDRSMYSSYWRKGRKDISFVRGATSGQGTAQLPHSAVDMIETSWGHFMRELGYI